MDDRFYYVEHLQQARGERPFLCIGLGNSSEPNGEMDATMPIVRPLLSLSNAIPEPAFLGALAALGGGALIVLAAEIEAVLALGVSPDRIVYANPCKSEAHIGGYSTSSSGSCRRVRGIRVSFHVGGGATHSACLQRCNSCCQDGVLTQMTRLGMPHMHILNIGGGFGVGHQYEDAAITITNALRAYFANYHGLTVIFEHGRFFA
ncbi:hypothetical protein IFM89_030503 [Coptis chinensis]|uniref:Orn/DAP/Arg decarboxylase 2 N-terminal domain-containing protein n=1 Tax=Coptis chinensis TaxID=261450 RepID=A0A835H7S2_9MAGN|nr:hypothetical protein IFM89_030503 [Coptis chinensis]